MGKLHLRRAGALVAGLSVFLIAYAVAGVPKPATDDYTHWPNQPKESFADPAKAFSLVKEKLLAQYYDDGLTEAELYRLAVRGMLEGLNEKGAGWNKLFSPTEYHELTGDMAGQVVGIGVEIRFDAARGIADVIGILPGTAAERAGLRTGDAILKVGAQSFRGQTLRDVVYAIRGKAGEKVALTVLRDDKVFIKTVRREDVPWNSVESRLLSPGVGGIRIRYFSENTAKRLREALAQLTTQGARAFVIDLRDNAGGLFDQALESIALFLPDGTPIVKAVHRGHRTETLLSHGKPVVAGVPLAVLVNAATSCSAEIMADALRTQRRASIVGHRTFGKWNAQQLEELPNGFAYKFTTGTFETPAGKDLNGVGLEPDIAVDLPENKTVDQVQRIEDPQKRLVEDPPLRTALGVLKIQREEKT